MLELINVTKKYREKKHKKETIALNNVSYRFDKTGLYFVTGKSGSGKSTLLSILSGIDFSFDGDLVVDNKSIKEFNKNEINYYRSTYIGYVFQDYNLIPELNAYENVKLGFDVSSNENINEVDDIFKKLDIEDLKTRDINELSGGEKQRIAIARSLVKKPKVILADEPTGALDPINSKNIMDLLNELSKEYLVIIVTHNINYLDEYESKKLYLDHGNMTTTDISSNKDLATYSSKKYKGLSLSHKLKIGFETLFHKKITLFFSLFFVILSLILISISVSGARYNENYAVYKTMQSNDSYVMVKYYYYDDVNDPRYIDKDNIEYVEKNCSDNVKAYSVLSLIENADTVTYLSGYYAKDNDDDFSYYEPKVFKYDSKSIDLFGLDVIYGDDDLRDDEILITDLMAMYFINYEYSNQGYVKEIQSYSDLIGLSIFDKTISGIVSTKNSEEYFDLYNHQYDDTDEIHRKVSLAVQYGIANAIFTKKELYSDMPIYVKNDVRNSDGYSRYGNDELVRDRSGIINNVEYFDGFDENSHGIIYNANYISKIFSGYSYEEAIDNYYNELRSESWNKGVSDEELYEKAATSYKEDLIYFSKGKSTVSISPEERGDYAGLISQVILNGIGISYDFDCDVNFYLDIENIEEYNMYLNYTNVVAMFGSIKNTNKDFFDTILDNYKITEDDGPNTYYLLLANEYADMIHRQKTVFNVLRIVFTAVGFAFLLIAMFVLYKCINDAISYKEKTIGVLKSIGVSSLDIFEIFSIQSVFIIILSLISSLLLQYLGVYAVNAVMSKVYGINQFIHSYRVSIFNWLTIIGIAIIIPFIATVSPIIKLSLKNPKDVLNKE